MFWTSEIFYRLDIRVLKDIYSLAIVFVANLMNVCDAGIKEYYLLPLIKIGLFQSKDPLILCCIRSANISLSLVKFLFIKIYDKSPCVGFLFFIFYISLVITPNFGHY